MSCDECTPLCSTLCTAAAFLPSCIATLRRPSERAFLYCLASCAFAFFLFSFQVHEKTILFPLLPLALLVLVDRVHALCFVWLAAIANFRFAALFLTANQQSLLSLTACSRC